MDTAVELRDWTLVQSFLAVAEQGSLSAAARLLGRSQPTLGRDIATFEEVLGLSLFERHPRGLRLSPDGEALLPSARQMRSAWGTLTLAAAGRSDTLSGTVRIAASVFVSQYVLPPVLAAMRATEPAIQIELVASDDSENLLFREADIAVRMYRPEQPDLLTRRVAEIELGIFAARSYLEHAGRPRHVDDLLGHTLVGYDKNPLIIESMAAMGWQVEREQFAVRCDNQATYWELVRAGCGIGFSQRAVGLADPLIEEVDVGLTLPALPVWLTAHPAMQRTQRVRRVWTHLADKLRIALA